MTQDHDSLTRKVNKSREAMHSKGNGISIALPCKVLGNNELATPNESKHKGNGASLDSLYFSVAFAQSEKTPSLNVVRL